MYTRLTPAGTIKYPIRMSRDFQHEFGSLFRRGRGCGQDSGGALIRRIFTGHRLELIEHAELFGPGVQRERR